MSDQERYASVPERITWTTGFHNGVDKHVLGVLSTFANFKTGKGARMSIAALAMRAGMERRRVERALRRLVAERWVTPHRWHRHATSWDIDTDRLATNWVGAKMVHSSRDKKSSDANKNLTVNSDAVTVTIDGQPLDLTVNIDGPIPCTSDPQNDPQVPGCTAPQQLTLGPEDLSPETGARFDAASTVDAIKTRLATLPPFDTRRRMKHG